MGFLYRFLTISLVVTVIQFSLIGSSVGAFAQEGAASNEPVSEVVVVESEQKADDTQEKESKNEDAMPKLEGYDSENILVLELKDGATIRIEMLPEVAPNHVKRVKELVREGFYDGIVFHRVIDGFMAQTGDPTGTGTGGSGQKLEAEFSDKPHTSGAVSMARAQDPNSADSQFFIVFEDSRFLDKQYTIWGYVIDGMDKVLDIKRGDPARNGMVTDPDKMVTLRVLADVEKEEQENSVKVESSTSSEETVSVE